jgi:uncharacterized cupin superfamily protein
MIDLTCMTGLSQMDLGPFAAKPTSVEGDQIEASVTLATSADGRTEIGVWECSEGRFTADRRASSEFCHFIAGEVEMTHTDGRKQRLRAGDAVNLPLGWTGEWRVIQRVRKLYVITQG